MKYTSQSTRFASYSNGRGIALKGTAFCKEALDDNSVGQDFDLYSDKECLVQIINPSDEDTYIVQGFLMAYSGEGNKFTCAGQIQGEPGQDGRGVSNIVNYYMASSRGEDVEAGSRGEIPGEEEWSTSVQDISAERPYLWNYEIVYYSDETYQATPSAIIGYFSDEGPEGRGITEIREFYCITTTPTCKTPTKEELDHAGKWDDSIVPVPGTWYLNSPPTDQTNRYLWNVEQIVYTKPDENGENSTTSFPVMIGAHGKDGQNGSDGSDGADGVNGASKSTIYAYYRTNTAPSSIVPSPVGKPVDTIEENGDVSDHWTLMDIDPTETHRYVYRSEGVLTVADVGISHDKWQASMVYKAWIDNATVSYENYAELLKITNYNESGLHYNNDGKLYISADYLQVTSDKNGVSGDIVFSADNGSDSVYMAGWVVKKDSISTGTPGRDGFHMYSNAKQVNHPVFGPRDWRLLIGSQFGLGGDGTLYASAGRIGNMDIGDIEQMGVKNLITFFTFPTIMHHIPTVSDWDGNHLTWTLTKDMAQLWLGTEIFDTVFEEGKIYTLSFKFQVVDKQPAIVGGQAYAPILKNIGGHSKGFDTLEFIVDDNQNQESFNEGVAVDDDMMVHEVLVRLQYNGDADDGDNSLYIQLNRNVSGLGTLVYNLWDVMLTEGEVAEDWRHSSLDLSALGLNINAETSANTNSNYSWKFSPTDGIIMWNGGQNSGEVVLSINSETGLTMNGNGTFSGHVVAKTGRIANWQIEEDKLWTGEFGQTGFHIVPQGYATLGNEYFGVSDKKWVLGIGSKFGIDVDGNIYAQGGQIAGWGITSNMLSSNSIKLCSDNSLGQYGGSDIRIAAGGKTVDYNQLKWSISKSTPVTIQAGQFTGEVSISTLVDIVDVDTWIDSDTDWVIIKISSDRRKLTLTYNSSTSSTSTQKKIINYRYSYVETTSTTIPPFMVTDNGNLYANGGRIGRWTIDSTSGALKSNYKQENVLYNVSLYGWGIEVQIDVSGGGSSPPMKKYWHELL